MGEGLIPLPPRDHRGRFVARPVRRRVRHSAPALWVVWWLGVLAFVCFPGTMSAAAAAVLTALTWLAMLLGVVVAVVAVALIVGVVSRRVTARRAQRRRELLADAQRWQAWAAEQNCLGSAWLWAEIVAHRETEVLAS